jgi:subtilisin family serine protease
MIFRAAVMALALPAVVGAQAPTIRFSIGLRSLADSAVVLPKLAAWKLTVIEPRYDVYWAVRGRADSMPVGVLDSLKLLKDSLGVLTYAEHDATTGTESRDDTAAALASWGLDSLRLPRAWSLGVTGAGVRVAVMDTGFETQHPEFAGRVEQCVSFVPIDTTTPMICRQTVASCNHHGTHVASTAVGATRGVAKDATLVAIKIFEDVGGECSAWGSVRTAAMHYARAQGAQVVNVSTGSGSGLSSERLAVNAAHAEGMTVCGSSGNANGYQALFPGAFPTALAIGALTSSLSRASYSNRDTLDLDFAFPGSGISGAIGSSGYGSKSGTSMASPHCAGYFALLRQALPTVPPDSLWAIARQCAKDLATPGHDPGTGWGMPRADCGVATALGLDVQPTHPTGAATLPRGSVGCLPVTSPVEWAFTGTVPGVILQVQPCGLAFTVAPDAPVDSTTITLIGVP